MVNKKDSIYFEDLKKEIEYLKRTNEELRRYLIEEFEKREGGIILSKHALDALKNNMVVPLLLPLEFSHKMFKEGSFDSGGLEIKKYR